MNHISFKFAAILAIIALAVMPGFAQNGYFNAADFAYGNSGNPYGPFYVLVGNVNTGVQSMTVDFAAVAVVPPGTAGITTLAPITIGNGSTRETVTPSATSCTTPGVYGTCQFTANFRYTHGRGEPIISGSCGLEEAIKAARTAGGGIVVVDGRWLALGCTTTTITTNAGYTNVTVLDWTGTTGAKSYTASSDDGTMSATSVTLY